MKLYHVSIFKDGVVGDKQFYKRVPFYTMDGEEQLTKRVCLSDSIEGCLSAIEVIWFNYRAAMSGKNIDIEVLSVEADEEDSNFINSEKLKYLVPDAHLTHEYWYIGEDAINLKSEGVFTIKGFSFDLIGTRYVLKDLKLVEQTNKYLGAFNKHKPTVENGIIVFRSDYYVE